MRKKTPDEIERYHARRSILIVHTFLREHHHRRLVEHLEVVDARLQELEKRNAGVE
jgi:hypothetical protein